jgi:hypothetical protein
MPLHLNYLERPKLEQPILIAGLPGIAQIAKLGAEYLIYKLRARKFVELYSSQFPEWVIREDGSIKMLKVDFFYCRPDGLKHDLILVTADAQATSPIGQYKLTGEILDIAQEHGVDKVVTMAAYVLSLGESIDKVVGVASGIEMAKFLGQHRVRLLDGGMIVGMNGLLLGLAAERGMYGFCLLGTTRGGFFDVGATKEVLHVLSTLLGFRLDLEELHHHAMTLPKFKLKFKPPTKTKEEISYIW